MNFTDIKSFTYIENIVVIDGVQKNIKTKLPDSITAVQFHQGNDFLIEEPAMKKVALEKYEFALEEFDPVIVKAEEVEVINLDDLKAEKTTAVNVYFESLIVSGFASAALGSDHTYQSEITDQINLMGLLSSNQDDLIKCKDEDGWDWKMHTQNQIKTVFDDGVNFKKKKLLRAAYLKKQISQCQTKEDIESIVIDDE